MSRLLSSALSLRRNPRLLKLPPYLSLFCITIGVAWLFLLPLDGYSRKTYISENALLPGQVHTYFGASDQHVLRAYRNEVNEMASKDNRGVNDELEQILMNTGLKVGRQNYTYRSAGDVYSGQNIYAILQAPRGDATEAIVLVAAWRTISGELNQNGVALALVLARYFKRWSLWSKDIIILIPPDSKMGTQAWVDAYHDSHDSSLVGPLPLKAGLLQGAIAIDYSHERRFEAVHIVYDGINGQLPNLDLINSITYIANGQMAMGSTIQDMFKHSGRYYDNLQTMLRGMLRQGLGNSAGPHSSFIPYHVDAVTIQPYGEGWHDEMAMGRLIEGSFRSLNNLLEHLHQSFFFYLLVRKDRFVSIGTYLPSAMLIAANYTIMAIYMWVKSGEKNTRLPEGSGRKKPGSSLEGRPGRSGLVSSLIVERSISLPLGIVTACQALGFVPLFIFTHTSTAKLSAVFYCFSFANCAIPFLASHILATYLKPSPQQFQLMKSFSLLFFGMALSSLATLNFSLAFLVGLLASPLSFTHPWPENSTMRAITVVFMNLIAPTTVVYTACTNWNVSMTRFLSEAAFGWDVWGMYTPAIVWCVWWPAWLAGTINVLGVGVTADKASTEA